MKKLRINLTAQIFLGLVLGAIFGYFLPDIGSQLKPLGDAFIRMIKMIVVPLIFSTLIIGIAGTGDFKKLGRLGGKAIIWFEVASSLALVVGLVVVNVLQPGVGVSLPSIGASAGANAAATAESFSISMHLLNIIPANIVEACAKSDMLQIIFFSCFFGVALAHIGEKGKIVVECCRGVAEAMFKVTHYVMLCTNWYFCHDFLYCWYFRFRNAYSSWKISIFTLFCNNRLFNYPCNYCFYHH